MVTHRVGTHILELEESIWQLALFAKCKLRNNPDKVRSLHKNYSAFKIQFESIFAQQKKHFYRNCPWRFLTSFQTLFGEELEPGQIYELVITTLSGLCRYRIGDIVKVVRFHNQCPVIEFQYRQGQLLNMRSEKTSETMLYEAITKVIGRKGEKAHLVDYTCAESILLDFVPSCWKTCAKSQVELSSLVKPFYVIFMEVEGLQKNAAQSEALAEEVSYFVAHQLN